MITDRERDRIAELHRTGQIRPMPDGPILETFDRVKLAELIEQQAIRAKLLYDTPRVDLRMSVDDALELVKVLRG